MDNEMNCTELAHIPIPEELGERLSASIDLWEAEERHMAKGGRAQPPVLRKYALRIAAIAASVVVVSLVGGYLANARDGHVCYTIEEGRRITDPGVVMANVEQTLGSVLASDNMPDVERQMRELLN